MKNTVNYWSGVLGLTFILSSGASADLASELLEVNDTYVQQCYMNQVNKIVREKLGSYEDLYQEVASLKPKEIGASVPKAAAVFVREVSTQCGSHDVRRWQQNSCFLQLDIKQTNLVKGYLERVKDDSESVVKMLGITGYDGQPPSMALSFDLQILSDCLKHNPPRNRDS